MSLFQVKSLLIKERNMSDEKEFIPQGAMSIHAHPDNQEFTIAGNLATWAKTGCKVVSAPVSRVVLALMLLLSVSLACSMSGTPTPAEMLPPTTSSPRVILQRLQITYLGLDGHRLVGSGCPGETSMGSIENYHFIVQGVDIDRRVQRVLVTGDNSTLTWESPCKDDWGLAAKEIRPGTWEVYIAPSLPSHIYTLLFFYNDNTLAIGMTDIH
jgi:hypothetical protein